MRSLYSPNYLTPPGATLDDLLAEGDLAQFDFAQSIGESPHFVSELIKGHVALTPKIADRLEALFGVTAEYWLRHEHAYRDQAKSDGNNG